MSYDLISKQIEKLNYRDKLRLAQLLIQLARKEEEEINPEKRKTSSSSATVPSDPELIQYVAERLLKLRPSKRETLLNSIGAMFQFQGGISDGDKEKILSELMHKRHLSITKNNRVQYSD